MTTRIASQIAARSRCSLEGAPPSRAAERATPEVRRNEHGKEFGAEDPQREGRCADAQPDEHA